jgi:hypothetical protein
MEGKAIKYEHPAGGKPRLYFVLDRVAPQADARGEKNVVETRR